MKQPAILALIKTSQILCLANFSYNTTYLNLTLWRNCTGFKPKLSLISKLSAHFFFFFFFGKITEASYSKQLYETLKNGIKISVRSHSGVIDQNVQNFVLINNISLGRDGNTFLPKNDALPSSVTGFRCILGLLPLWAFHSRTVYTFAKNC